MNVLIIGIEKIDWDKNINRRGFCRMSEGESMFRFLTRAIISVGSQKQTRADKIHDKKIFAKTIDKNNIVIYICCESNLIKEKEMLKMGIIGQAARGDTYLPRPQITKRILDKLFRGGNVLLVAPRRVGKSSVLFNLLDNPPMKTRMIYYQSESVNNIDEYYKKLFKEVVDHLEGIDGYKAKISILMKSFFSRIEEVSLDGNLKLGERKISFLTELQKLIEDVDLKDEKLVILNDELPSTVENIMRDEGTAAAIHFLETLREIRQSPNLHNKVQFIYAGSIGLENIVSKLESINLINDLVPVVLPPLNRDEAFDLVEKILKGSSVTLSFDGFEHLLKVIEWWIPYYFQILLDEAYNILQDRDEKVIEAEIIDDAVTKALKHRLYFEHWFTRLRKAYAGDEFSFVKDVLNRVSENQTASSAEVINLAVRHKLEGAYNHLINALKHDGYVNNEEDAKIYRFNSPLLREWWRCNVAN